MAFRFRKIRQTLRLMPSTKSLGFSTRANEGDPAKKNTPALTENNSACAIHEISVQLNPNGAVYQSQSLFPLTRCASQPDALQVTGLGVTLPVPVKSCDNDLLLLPQFKSHGSSDDLDLLLATVKKPVNFTCDDILFDAHSKEGCEARLPKDMSWERSSVKLVLPSVHHSGFEDMKFENLSEDSKENYHHNSFHNTSQKSSFPSPTSCDSDSFNTFLFSTPAKDSSSAGNAPKDGPTAEQLHNVREKIEKNIPVMFTGRHDYSILHKDVILENNLFGGNKILRGINSYALELMKVRFRFYARYTSTHTEILNITTQDQSGVIKVHWRLKGLPQTQVLKFWRLFQSGQEIKKEDWEWVEAFSYFHVGKDGLVHKHRIDRMLPDNEEPNKLTDRISKLLNPAKPLVS